MAISENKKKEYIRRLLFSRMRILCNNGFYGILLMHARFALDEELTTAATDGNKIYFSPKFLEELTDGELDFVMMHEILHIALKHCYRDGDRDPQLFNIACDIVVNSNILKSNGMDEKTISVGKYGVSMHLTPTGKEGYEFTAEEVYEMLLARMKKKPKDGWDDHDRWGKQNPASQNGSYQDDADDWEKHVLDACQAIETRDPTNARGSLPACAEMILQNYRNPQIDWRKILQEFVQEEIVDYSFLPPDRRFDDFPFFLPDFNDLGERVANILFMIDTSGSMTDKMINTAFSEVCGAVEQFGGKLQGWLGFFDAAVHRVVPFEDGLPEVKAVGRGGTDFGAVFRYIKKEMQENLPVSIIILTDGYAPFPPQEASMGIPVLWLLNNKSVNPPWGRIARISVKD